METKVEELWKEISYNKNYSVSVFGRVRNNKTGRILKLQEDHCGYLRVRIGRITYKAHRLVAIAFCDNKCNLPCVNHIDADRKNNHVSNLEWCTHSDNIRHAHRLGRMKVSVGVYNPMAKLTEDQVIEIRSIYGMTYSSIAKIYGVSEKTISQVVRRIKWSHVK